MFNTSFTYFSLDEPSQWCFPSCATILIMEMDHTQLITQIHATPGKIVLVAAGAGATAITALLGVAGASRTLLEARVPYDGNAFADFLGQVPKQYVSAATGRLLAGRALGRATWLLDDEIRPIGVACTATIVTDRPKRGDHRAHVAVWRPDQITSIYLKLAKGARNRSGEESIVRQVVLNAIAAAYDLDSRLSIPLIEGDVLETSVISLAAPVEQLLAGDVPFVAVHADGRVRLTGVQPQLLLSGSFNPLHAGHLALAAAAMELTNRPIAFEIPVVNADKPSLPLKTTLHRLAQFAGRWPVYLSSAPTFLAKAALFPGATFVVGYDTATRVLEPRFYGGSHAGVLDALATIRDAGCTFLVAGRERADGSFGAATALDVPAGFDALFRPIPAFRVDISSTELRRRGASGSR